MSKRKSYYQIEIDRIDEQINQLQTLRASLAQMEQERLARKAPKPKLMQSQMVPAYTIGDE